MLQIAHVSSQTRSVFNGSSSIRGLRPRTSYTLTRGGPVCPAPFPTSPRLRRGSPKLRAKRELSGGGRVSSLTLFARWLSSDPGTVQVPTDTVVRPYFAVAVMMASTSGPKIPRACVPKTFQASGRPRQSPGRARRSVTDRRIHGRPRLRRPRDGVNHH